MWETLTGVICSSAVCSTKAGLHLHHIGCFALCHTVRLKAVNQLTLVLDLSLPSPPLAGIDFEECYKEYLPTTYATAKKLAKDNLDPISPPIQQIFPNPAVTFQSPMTKATPTAANTAGPLSGPDLKAVHVHVTNSNSGLPQVSSMYSKPQPQNGFSNALDLANMPQMRVGAASANNHSFTDFPSSLTQPEPYHSAFPSDFGFSSFMQFGFPSHPMPPHPTTAGGMAPISVLVPPLASNTSTNPDPSGIGAGGDSFTDFFPALLSENPLDENSQEAIPAESAKKSVSDLFNLTAGLDVFEDTPILERNVNRDIGEVDMKKDESIESSWNQPLTAANENNNANRSSFQANEEGSPFVHGSKEANETIVSEESVKSSSRLHPLGRMDSFGFATSLNSKAPGFDAGVNMLESTPPASNGNPNWPNFDQIPNTQSPMQTGTLINGDKNISGEINVNTESVVQTESTKVKDDQKVNRAKVSPKGKKKKKKGAKTSSNEASSRSGSGAVKNANVTVSVHPPPSDLEDGSTCMSEDITSEASVALTEELVGIEERKPRSINYSLSSSSTPTLVGVSLAAGFRSEGHTPPINTSEVTVDISATTAASTKTTTSLQPFADVVSTNEDNILPDMSDLHNSSKMEGQGREIGDIFDGGVPNVSDLAATFGKIEGRSSILNSIMAARAKNKESDMNMQVDTADDVSTFKSTTKVSVFERIKDIEDDSSQESHENDQVEELTAAPSEGSEATCMQQHVNSEDIPVEEVPETKVVEMEQLPQASPNQPEVMVPNTAVEPAKPDTQPAEPENPAVENEKVAMPEEGDPVREDINVDSGMTIPTTNAGMFEFCI